MLEIRNMSKKFGSQQVLDGVNLSIEKGKVVVIIGPSGTGKSTLLRCINFLEKPEKGTIKLDDHQYDYENLDKESIKLLRTKTSMVFQNSNLFRNKTAIENITTPLLLVKKMNRKEAEKIGVSLLEKVGMLEKKDCYPETLSGGERQRVGIARALLEASNEYRPTLKSMGLLTRDARAKERKKYGLKGARRAPQFSKR